MIPSSADLLRRATVLIFCTLGLLAAPLHAQHPDAAPAAADSATVSIPEATHAAEHPAEAAHTEAAHGSKKLDVKELLFGHVTDSHEWHITDIPGSWVGADHAVPVALHLPYIVYNSAEGLQVFSLHGHSHAELVASAREHGYALDHRGRVAPLAAGVTALDFSITKNVLHMMLVGIVLCIVMIGIARSYARRKGMAPKGAQSLFEPVILFVRDEIAKPNMHGKHDRFLPYLLSLFFFIWFSNLFGLTPFNSNIAGNITFTAALAILTFLLVQFSGTRDYWGHIFWFPGVPVPMKLLIGVIEFIGLFTKPFSLTIRLFANILAGHFMILSLVSLIFILYGSFGIGGAAAITPLSLAFGLLIMCIEVLVAVIQAYVFTLLTAIFIGQALETHHDEHNHNHEQHDVQTLAIHEGHDADNRKMQPAAH